VKVGERLEVLDTESGNGSGAVCRLVRRPGLKQDHSELERDLRGSARVYSKVLVEENKNELLANQLALPLVPPNVSVKIT